MLIKPQGDLFPGSRNGIPLANQQCFKKDGGAGTCILTNPIRKDESKKQKREIYWKKKKKKKKTSSSFHKTLAWSGFRQLKSDVAGKHLTHMTGQRLLCWREGEKTKQNKKNPDMWRNLPHAELLSEPLLKRATENMNRDPDFFFFEQEHQRGCWLFLPQLFGYIKVTAITVKKNKNKIK